VITDLTTEEREELRRLANKLRKRVDQPNSHFTSGTYGAITSVEKNGELGRMRAFDRFLTRDRSTTSVQWVHIVLSAYPEAPDILSLTDEQVDAFLRMDSFVTSLGSVLGSASDAICLLVIEDIEQEQKIKTLLDRGITNADTIRGILPVMDRVEPVLIDGLL
jgi:hypothetical protein